MCTMTVPEARGDVLGRLIDEYYRVRWGRLADRKKTIARWRERFGEMVYDRNDQTRPGVGLILIARKR